MMKTLIYGTLGYLGLKTLTILFILTAGSGEVSHVTQFNQLIDKGQPIEACDYLRENYLALQDETGNPEHILTLNNDCTELYQQHTNPENHVPGQT